GNVRSVGIKKYTYTNISTDARFASQFFSGALTIKDPNVQVAAKGSIDLRDDKNLINIQAKIDTLNLHTVNIAHPKLFIHADVDINMRGLTLDSLVGTADLKNITVNLNARWLHQDSISITTTRDSQQRTLHLQ